MVRIWIALLHQGQYLMGCCSFCFAWILWSSKRGGFEQPVPRTLRPAGRFWGAAWRIPSDAQKKRIAMYFGNALLGLM